MHRLSVLIKTQDTPRCPGCQAILTSGSIRFLHGKAVCGSCVSSTGLSRINESVLILHNQIKPKFVATQLGLLFYVPDYPLEFGLAFANDLGDNYQIDPHFSIMGKQKP